MDLPEKYEDLFKLMNHSSDDLKDIEWINSKESELGTKIPLSLKTFLLNYNPDSITFKIDFNKKNGFSSHYEIAIFEINYEEENSFILEKSDQELIDCPVYFVNEEGEIEKLFDSIYDWFMASIGKSKCLNEINLTDEYKDFLTFGSTGFNVKSKYWIENTEKQINAKLPSFLKAILLKYSEVYFQAPGSQTFCGETIRETLDDVYQDYFTFANDGMNSDFGKFVIEKSKEEVQDCPVYFTHDHPEHPLGRVFDSVYEMMNILYHCEY